MAQLVLSLGLFVSELTCKKWGSNEDLNIEGVQTNPKYKLDTLVLSVAETWSVAGRGGDL